MWLIDENLDVRLHQVLADAGITAHTAEFSGLKGLANGKLLETAARLGYTVILTRDVLYAQDSGFLQGQHPTIAIIIVKVTIPQNRICEWFRDELQATPIQPVPGKVVVWPS